MLEIWLKFAHPPTQTALIRIPNHCTKPCGSDCLSSEYLVNAHPLLVIHLCALLGSMISYGFVPDAFSFGTMVPVDANYLNNYRGITLIPIIYNHFGHLL